MIPRVFRLTLCLPRREQLKRKKKGVHPSNQGLATETAFQPPHVFPVSCSLVFLSELQETNFEGNFTGVLVILMHCITQPSEGRYSHSSVVFVVTQETQKISSSRNNVSTKRLLPQVLSPIFQSAINTIELI